MRHPSPARQPRTASRPGLAGQGGLILAVCLVAGLAGLAAAGDYGSRAMSGWFNVTSPDGWPGRRYMDGDYIFAEEFDSNNDGRLDVWRFYRRGLLSSEERDLNGDGKVDYQTRWDTNTGSLIAVLRDTHKRGINDVELEWKGRNRWELREDRNLDGITDSILIFNAPINYFDSISLGGGLATQGEIAATIPREYWRELHVDEAFTGNITEYYRFARGNLTHRGEWTGRRIAWTRAPADYASGRIAGRRTDVQTPPPSVVTGPPLPSRQPPFGESPAVTAVRAPVALAAGAGVDVDPYSGLAGPRAAPPPVADPGIGYVPPMRRDGLPAGESSARSVPARMRMPGTSTR
ncbi:MAG: hypothetical protein LIP18_07450 [Planctomycetes bacterium]|nr:hypothetical protein [Planctomycetota bacterium]